MDRKQLIETFDNVFSLYIRLFYANTEGYVHCCTCGRVDHYSNMQNGHYCLREHMSTRYLFENCHPQCYDCNVINKGLPDHHAAYINNLHGSGTAEYLQTLAKQSCRITNGKLKEDIKDYRGRIRFLKKKKGII